MGRIIKRNEQRTEQRNEKRNEPTVSELVDGMKTEVKLLREQVAQLLAIVNETIPTIIAHIDNETRNRKWRL